MCSTTNQSANNTSANLVIICMKKILALVISIMALCACQSTTYKIDGSIEGAQEGDTVVLGYSNNGQDFKATAKTAIKDGRFTFNGEVDGCKIYYIGYEGAEEPIYAMFFLEPGNIKADITYTGSHITGTTTNDKNIELEEKLEQYVVEMLQYQDTLYRDTTLTDDKKAELGNNCYKVQQEAMTYIQDIIRDNIDNMIGIFMLVQYSDLFDNNELSSLIAAIPGKLIDRDNNYLYDILLQIQEERNTPGTIDEIINAIEEEGEELKLEKNYNSEIEE